MQEYRRAAFVLLGLLVLAALAPPGCGGDPRSELAKATDRARRLYDKACSHLKDPVYKVEGKDAPLTVYRQDLNEQADRILDLDANDPQQQARRQKGLQEFPITPASTDAINPLAGEAIRQAAEELSAALKDAADAPPVEIARAHAMLARVHALQGFSHAIEAAQERDKAWSLVRRLENAAIQMGDHGKRVANCDALLSVTDKSLGEMSAKAKADEQTAGAKIAGMKKQIDGLKTQKAALEAANERLLAAARKLHVDSQLADVLQGIELFDQAKAKENQATANSVKITETEDSIQFLSSQIATLDLDVAAAGKRSAVADKIAADRRQRQAATRKQRDDFIKLLTESQKEVETLAGSVIKVCKGASAIEEDANSAYGRAVKQYEEYGNSTARGATGAGEPSSADPVITALFGDARMARADLRVRSLALQDRIDHVIRDVKKLWSSLPVQKDVPAIVEQVTGYVTEAGKVRKAAQDDFRWAAKNYESACEGVSGERLGGRVVGKKLQWVYRIQTAAAYTGWYRISGDGQVRQKAIAALDELGEEAGSRYVAPHAAHFRKLLATEVTPPPTSAPVTP